MPLKLTRRHGSPYWYIRGSIRGVLVDESTGLGDKADAQDVLALRQAQIVRQSVHGHAAVRTFADAALSYMEAGGERVHLDPILKHFGPRKLLAQIGQHEIDEAAARLKPGASPSTRNRHIYTPIAAVLHHAARKKWCEKPVIARPAEPKGRVRWISYEDADRLILAAAPHLQPLVIFLLCTGARLSEALYLDWTQVDLGRAHVVFLNKAAGGPGTKNDESRGMPLHPRALAALHALPHRHGAVFRCPIKGRKAINPTREQRLHGAPYAVRAGGGGQLRTSWRTMCRRAGVDDFTPHDCRHTWATWHYRENRDLPALMELGGWKSVTMVMRYAHVNTAHLAGSVAKIWDMEGPVEVQATGQHRT